MFRARNLLVILVLSAGGYLWFFGMPTRIVYQSNTVAEEPPIQHLSAFVDANMDKIFSPLSEVQALMPLHDLRQVQQNLQDQRLKAKSDQERRLYDTGMSICKQMIDAVALRESHNGRLADMRKNGFEALLVAPKNKKSEQQKKKDFFESSVIRDWNIQAVKAREQIQYQYDQMRLLERQAANPR